jgi:DNA-binding GntR family transcriptional regulator
MMVAYRTMQEIVCDAIRDGILSGRYPAGQRLVAADLAQELGVSRMPVREALHRLVAAGLVSMLPHRGAVVSEFSQSEIVELYHIRAALDGLATRLAAPRFTAPDSARLEALLREMAIAVKAKDPEKVLRANREFHRLVWQAARAPRLHALLENLYDASQRFRNMSVVLPGRLARMTQEHRRIARALTRGDAGSAERAAIAHYEGTARKILTSMRAGRGKAKE